MPTVSLELAQKLVNSNGKYPGDPLPLMILSYEHTQSGETCGFVAYTPLDLILLFSSPFVGDTAVLWKNEKRLAKYLIKESVEHEHDY